MIPEAHLSVEAKTGVEEAFKSSMQLLLENKHLYQRVTVEIQEEPLIERLQTKMKTDIDGTQREGLHSFVGEWLREKNWLAVEPDNLQYATYKSNIALIEFTHANMVCSHCRRRNAYNTQAIVNVLNTTTPNEVTICQGKAVNIFMLKMQCQSCKGVPEAILVRREGDKLTLSGRSPMEHLEVPNDIHKSVSKFYGDAMLANNSGQHLPALFMLRTLIEQWAYKNVTDNEYADHAVEQYMEKLPEDFKSRFPSLKALYGELSADIHCATGSEELFEKAKAIIEEHFEALRLFRLRGEDGLINSNDGAD